MYTKLFIAILLCVSAAKVKAQLKKDISLELSAAEKQLKTEHFQQVVMLVGQLLPLCDSLKYKDGLIDCYKLLGLINECKGNPDTAIIYFNSAITLCRDDRQYWCKAYLGWAYRDKGDFKMASLLLYPVLEYAEKNNPALGAYVQLQLGQIATSLKNYPQANNFLTPVLSNPEYKANALLDLGELALRQKHYEKAEEYLLKSKQLFEENGLVYHLAHVYNNLARVAVMQEDHTKAEHYYNLSAAIKRKFEDLRGLAVLYNNLGDLYAEQYKDAKAISAFKESATMASQIGAGDIKQAAFLNLSILMEDAGNYKEALDYRKASGELHDSLWNIAKTKEILALDEKYQVAQKEKDILSKTKQRNFWIAGFVFVCVLIIIGYYAFIQKIKLNRIITIKNGELEQLNKTKDYLFHVIGHDIRLPLAGLSRIADLITYCLQHNKTDSLLKVGEDVRLTVKRIDHLLSNLLTWGLSQTGQMAFQQEHIPVNRIFEQVASDFTAELNKKDVRLNSQLKEIYAFADSNSLKVILRNLLANAIKFTPAGTTIHVLVEEQKDLCLIKIKDEGEGLSTARIEQLFATKISANHQGPETGMGVGLFLCQQMAAMNQGNIYVGNPDKEGAEFICALPIA